MLIYEIVRHIVYPTITDPCLSCTFPSGHGHINVKLIWPPQQIIKALKFELNPETPIEVSVPLCEVPFLCSQDDLSSRNMT